LSLSEIWLCYIEIDWNLTKFDYVTLNMSEIWLYYIKFDLIWLCYIKFDYVTKMADEQRALYDGFW
jgi:hypothetical protein